MEYYYDLEQDDYILHLDVDHAVKIGPEIAILFDRPSGVLLNHGAPTSVSAKYAHARQAFQLIGHEDDLVFLSGKMPVEKINQAITCSGTCNKLFAEELAAIVQI